MKKFLPLLAVLLWASAAWNVQAQAPQMVSLSPDSNATEVPLDVVLKLEFNMGIRYNSTTTGKYVKIVETATPTNEILSALLISGSNYGDIIQINTDTLIIDPGSSALSPETQYSVIINSGAIENINDGTPFTGIDDVNTRWRFTTKSRPGLFSKSPANNAIGVTGLETLTLTFQEEITLGSNKNLHIYKEGGTLFQTINTTNDAGLITVSGLNFDVNISHDAFNGNQGFYVDVEEGFVTSALSGIGSAAIDGQTEWSFLSANGPSVASTSPGGTPGGTNGDKILVITYGEAVTLQSGKNITIYNGDGSVFQTISSDNTSLVTFDNILNFVSIDHDRFSGNSNYYVNIEEGLVTANDNNIASAAITGSSVWTFTTAPPPMMTFESPASGALNVIANEPLVIAFGEAVLLGNDKNLTIYNSDDTPFQTINTSTNAGLFSFNATNDTLTVTHNPFAGGSNYYVNMDEGVVISETTAIGSSSLTGTTTWSFTTIDGPTISSFQPDGDPNVPGNQIIYLNFSENVTPGNNKNLHIYRQSDNLLFQSINTTSDAGLFTAVDTSLQISHDPLWGSTAFYILADEGLAVSGSTGIDGEGISNQTRWTFSTTGGPVAESFTPAPITDSVSVSAPLEINFNENISIGNSGSLTIHLSSDNSVIETISFSSPLLSVSNDTLTINHTRFNSGTGYYINVENGLVLSSATGTPWTGINDQSWSFTTAGSPTINTYNPLNGETSAPVNQPLTLTFSENIKRGNSGYVKIREQGNTYFQDIPYSAGLITFNGQQLHISHDIFKAETTYFVTIDNDVIRTSATDVSFEGITDTTQWRFSTAKAPEITSFTPLDGSTLSSSDENLVITFDQNIQTGTSGSFRIRYAKSGATRFQTITTEETEFISITNNVMTISHLEFTPDTSYYVLIDEGFVRSSASGIAHTGIQDTTYWTFSAPAGPVISIYEPQNNSIDIAVDSVLSLTFNENIARGNGNLFIRRQSDGSDVVTISASSSSLALNGTILSVNNLNLPSETTLYVTMDAGFIQSTTSGFSFTGISDTTEWVFTTLPEPPAWNSGYPNFESITPNNIDLALMTNRVANYYFVVTSNSTPPTVQQIMAGQNSGGTAAYTSGTGSLDGINPLIHSGINISGLPNGYHWIHTVAKNPTKELYSATSTLQIDKQPPLTDIYPPDGTSHFPETSNMTISFDEAIYTSSGVAVDNTNVSNLVALELTVDGTPVACTVSIDALGTKITVNPDVALDPQTSYQITMSAVYDQIGNGQVTSTSSTFSTDKLNIWTGGGTDPANWDDAANWSTGSFLDNTSIDIPASATTFPVVSANTNVYNIDLEPGAALTHSAGTLTVNGEFRLQSSISANASYINTGGTLTVANDSVKIEQHITGLTHVYYISSPISGATKNSIGLDSQLFGYDNPTNSWIELSGTGGLVTGKGYVGKSSQSLVFSGAITTGTQKLDLTRSTAGLGWNLLGNPYTASINWDATSGITKSNIIDAFWIYLNDQGRYGAYNDNSGMSVNISDSKIPSNHAFWVKVVEGLPTDTGSVTISHEALQLNTNSYLKSAKSPKFTGFKLAAVSPGGTDETGVIFTPDASAADDKYDTDKMKASNPDLFQIFTTDSENKQLCINGLPEGENHDVTLGYIAGGPGDYSIRMQENYLPDNVKLILEDHLTNMEHNIGESDYLFNVDNKGTSTERFSLKTVQTVPTKVNPSNPSEQAKCLVYAQNSKIVVKTPDAQNLKYTLTDINGRTINNGLLQPLATNYINAPKTGVYILSIISNDGKEDHKVAVR